MIENVYLINVFSIARKAVRRLHHSVEAICLELHDSHPINVINLPPQVAVTVNSLMKGNVIKLLGGLDFFLILS